MAFWSAITGGLQFKHFRVAAADTGEVVVSSFFYDSATFEYYDAIGHAHG